MTMFLKKSYVYNVFNEQAQQLINQNSKFKEEVVLRVAHLKSKWDSIGLLLKSSDCGRCDQDNCLGKYISMAR